MSMQSLKKIGQKLLRLESGKEALTDGRTDTQNFKILGGYNIIPRHFFVWRGTKTDLFSSKRIFIIWETSSENVNSMEKKLTRSSR